jgi:hypothetical protein
MSESMADALTDAELHRIRLACWDGKGLSPELGEQLLDMIAAQRAAVAALVAAALPPGRITLKQAEHSGAWVVMLGDEPTSTCLAWFGNDWGKDLFMAALAAVGEG